VAQPFVAGEFWKPMIPVTPRFSFRAHDIPLSNRFTARAAKTASIVSDTLDWSIISIFDHREMVVYRLVKVQYSC
jgi:hypothetical protein